MPLLAYEAVDGTVGRSEESGWFSLDVQCNTALGVCWSRLDVFGFGFG